LGVSVSAKRFVPSKTTFYDFRYHVKCQLLLVEALALVLPDKLFCIVGAKILVAMIFENSVERLIVISIKNKSAWFLNSVFVSMLSLILTVVKCQSIMLTC